MKAKDLRERSTDDLVELRDLIKKELFSNRMKSFTNQLDDTSSLGKKRRDIARIELILHERKSAKDVRAAGGSES